MQPINDVCIDCGSSVNIYDRNYLVYDWENKNYRRQCAACHDKQNESKTWKDDLRKKDFNAA